MMLSIIREVNVTIKHCEDLVTFLTMTLLLDTFLLIISGFVLRQAVRDCLAYLFENFQVCKKDAKLIHTLIIHHCAQSNNDI